MNHCFVEKVNCIFECFICLTSGAVFERYWQSMIKRGIDKYLIEYKPTVFEFEVGCLLQGSGRTNGWWIVVVFQVILGLSMAWYQNWYVQKTKKFFLMWWMIYSYQGRWCFSYDNIWSHYFYFQMLYWVWKVMIQLCYSYQPVQSYLQMIK